MAPEDAKLALIIVIIALCAFGWGIEVGRRIK